MVTIDATERDDPQFIELVNGVLGSAVRLYRPDDIYIVQIDHWFDHKWLAFSGKVLGAVGVSKARLTLPPFNPNRVVRQVCYEAVEAAYSLASSPPLHIDQWSDANMQRFVDRVSESGVFVWYSGGTGSSDAASLLLYQASEGEASGSYASFKKKGGWMLNKVEGISRRELSALLGPSPAAHGI
jgi:hypothetical protein